jgi:hypothetical protein
VRACVRACVRAGQGYASGPEEPPIVCETIRAMALHSSAGSAGSEPSSAITASAPCRTHALSSELQPQIRSTQPVAIVETYCTTRGDSRVAAWRGVAPSCGRPQRRVRARRQSSCQLRRAGPFRQAAHDIHAGAKIAARAFLRVKPQSPSPEIVSHSVSWRSFSMIAAIAPACVRPPACPLFEAPACSACAREHVRVCVHAHMQGKAVAPDRRSHREPACPGRPPCALRRL